MSDVAIRVEGLSKAYRIAHQAEGPHRYRTLREDLVALARAPFSRRDGRPRRETIWALRDVSFEVKRGEVLGIIGRNGAGKSTLLKILARITRPTEGYADVFGRVGSLLEVGTGFHPELTGRENVFLSGAVLGMTRAEVRRKFDEIVDFAEIEKFLDTPVKRFSSGMYMRLAFAVAAHLEPEILLVDEVLAVGDAQFQKKCLGKMGEVASEGRTVLFVSHNMAAVSELCSYAYWLDCGTVREEGSASCVIQSYVSMGKMEYEVDLGQHPRRRKGKNCLMRKARLLRDGLPSVVFKTNERFVVEVEYNVADVTEIYLSFRINDGLGHAVFDANMRHYNLSMSPIAGETYTVRATIEALPLIPGRYGITLFLGNRSYDLDVVDDAIGFEVVWNESVGLHPPQSGWGPLHIPVIWDQYTHPLYL